MVVGVIAVVVVIGVGRLVLCLCGRCNLRVPGVWRRSASATLDGFEGWTSRWEKGKGVSEVLAAHGVGIGHAHRWKFYHGHWMSLVGAGH